MGQVSDAAALFAALLQSEPGKTSENLIRAHRYSLELAEYLVVDDQIRADQSDSPLDAEGRGQLTVLVRLAAPWLRGFPTIRDLDDRAFQAATKEDLVGPARALARIFMEHKVVSAEDASDAMPPLPGPPGGGRARTPGIPRKKAIALAVGDMTYLLLTAARIVAAEAAGVGSSAPADRELARRVAGVLVAARGPVQHFAAIMQRDIGLALGALTEEGVLTEPVSTAVEVPPAVAPPDVGAQARTLMVAGAAPPADWRPHILRLDFNSTRLGHLDLLSSLTALQRLSLLGTQVSDVSPVTRIRGLRLAANEAVVPPRPV